MVLRAIYRSVAGLALLFAIAVVLTQAGIAAGAAGYSLSEGFALSYVYLLPLQAMLLGVWGLLFFSKESLLLPSAENLRKHAQSRLTALQHSGAPAQQRALDLFIAGDLSAMLDFLYSTLQESSHSNTALLLKSRLAILKRQIAEGTVSDENARIEHNKISVAALALAETPEMQKQTPQDSTP